MVAHVNDLMMGVIVAATAFSGLTAVMFGYIAKKRSLVRAARLSLGCGIVAVLFAIAWFYLGQLELVAGVAVVLLLFQMFAAWTAVDASLRFWERRR
jgi:hypothetical protein